MAVAVDLHGNVYIADTYNQRVRMVDNNGVVSTIAGNGTQGFAGDGGPATSASFFNPTGIAVDTLGNIFVADQANNRIRRVDTNGIITTLAGNGIYSYSGDGGLATSAALAYPYGVTWKFGNLFIGDFDNNRIRMVDNNNIISTVAGNGANGSYGDGGLATNAALALPHIASSDGDGNLYIADTLNARIRKVDTNGIISTIVSGPGFSGDGGPASLAAIGNPAGVAVDSLGDVYVVDTNNSRIRWINLKPHANFTAAPDRGYRNLVVAFTNSTRTATGTTYSWDFSDGTNSTESNPSHTFANAGIYSVTLTAVGQSGLPEDTTSLIRPDYICAGYIFSRSPATATNAPFDRTYVRGTYLYNRVWALSSDVNYNSLRSATLTVRDGRNRSVTSNLTHEGNGVFSGAVLLNSSRLSAGAGTATFGITDTSRRTFTATQSITLQ